MASQVINLRPPFIDNPFCVLHLPADADPAEIQAKYAEARVSAQLEAEDSNDQLDRLLRAHSELLDTRSRWAHEATWFYSPPNCLFEGKIADEDELFGTYQEQAGRPGEEGIRGKHDLSNWLSLIAIHSDGNKEELTIRALSSWSELVEVSGYRSMMASNSSPPPTRDQLWDLAVISQFSLAAREEATLGNVDHVVSYIKAVQATGRTKEDVSNVAAEALHQLCSRVHDSIQEAQDQLDSVGNPGVSWNQWTGVITTQATLLKLVLSTIVESEAEVNPVFADCNSVLDGAAGAIREAAIDWFNDGTTTATTGVDMLNEARNIAGTEFRRGRLSTDLADLKYLEAMDQVVSYSNGQRWNQALDAARTALQNAPDEERREHAAGYVRRLYQLARQPSRTRNSGHDSGVKKIVALVVVVGLIVTCGVWFASLESTPSSSETSYPSDTQPTYAPPQGNSAPVRRSVDTIGTDSRQELKFEIENNEAQLDLLERLHDRQLAAYNAICLIDGCRLPPEQYKKASDLEAHLESIEAKYENLLRETNQLIDRYNAIR